MAQFVNVREANFSGGIDARSAESQVPEKFCESILDAETVEDRLRKRKGYQGFAGNLPVRVEAVQYDNPNDQICFTLDQSIDLSTLRSSPIVVYGRLHSTTMGTSPFVSGTDNVKYYTSFDTKTRRLFTAPSGVLTIPGNEHDQGTANLFVAVTESLSTVQLDYTSAYAGSGTTEVDINQSSFDIAIGYDVYVNTPVLIYYSDKDAVAGSVYKTGNTTVTNGSTTTISIPAGTHGLTNYNIIGQVYVDTGTVNRLVTADSLTISAAGQVDVTVSNNSGGSLNYFVILSAADVANTSGGTVGAGATESFTISNPTSPFVFLGIYLDNAGTLEQVIPDSYSYSSTNDEITITFTNSMGTGAKFEIYYEYGVIRSNQLCVDDATITAAGTDTAPQLTLWGLDHNEIYGPSRVARQGWTNHIDSYRRSGEQRLASGLGGNLFTAQTYAEAGTAYDYASLFASLSGRVAADYRVGPLFYDTGDTPARTRGYITADGSGTGWAKTTAVTYDSGTGWTKYTISLPNKAIYNSSGVPTSLSSVVSTTSGLQDWLVVEQMSHSRHEGTFRIRQVTDGVNEVVFWVENDQLTTSDYDDSGCGGQSGIFTDQLSFSTSPTQFVTNDLLLSSAFGDIFLPTVLSTSGTTVVASGFVDILAVAGGQQLYASRTSNVVALRARVPNPVASVTNLVRGDMLSYTDVDRLVRIKAVNPDTNRTVGITSDGTTAVVTLGSGNTDFLADGMSVILLSAGVYTGTVAISQVVDSTSFEFESTETDTVVGATLQGATVEIDEQLPWKDASGDTQVFTVEERWIPVEVPTDTFELTKDTYVQHFDSSDYDEQPFLRSTMVSNNLYLTNGQDEVFKFDGTNLYRAGLFPWQPGLFATQDTAATAEIVAKVRSIAYTAIEAPQGRVTVAAQDELVFSPGDEVLLTGSSNPYIVKSIDSTNFKIVFTTALEASVTATGTVTTRRFYKYYFRLNAVDANNNVIASAVTGAEDHILELGQDAAINLRLVGMPAWDAYDFDRLELEVFRTKGGTAAPFYHIPPNRPLEFSSNNGYIDFIDATADEDLTDLDPVNTALLGTEIGQTWQEPLRAKYVTSAANSLVLANLKDYPQFDIQLLASSTLTDAALANDTLLFRRDSATTGTVTDMLNITIYEWIQTSTAQALDSVTGTAGTSFVVDTTGPHGLTTGDWVYLFWTTVATTGRPLTYSGWWQVDVLTADTFRVRHTGSTAGALAGIASFKMLKATDPTNIPVPLGLDGNMGMSNGNSTFVVFTSMRRMGMAINTTMRKVDTTLSGMSAFTPWLVARAGGEFDAGQLIVRRPKVEDTTPELVWTGAGYSLFVNGISRSTTEQIAAQTLVFPSRLIVSYENYPEIFDSPTSVLDTDSDSAVDVNPADGQEITGVIPFFGDAAFGAAQQSSIVVVFKTNSIYLVDIAEKRAGRNAVQKIETEGLGCTAPYSIAVTKHGINFANESGMYSLNRNLAIRYLGKKTERLWLETANRDMLDIVQGHHFAEGRQYKLSYPLSGATENSQVFVYDHTAELEDQPGSWLVFRNHPSTGWANLGRDAYMASTTGRVFSVRRVGDETDYRDDSSAIEMDVEFRAQDFGNSGIRKLVGGFVVQYRVPAISEGTEASVAVDLSSEYLAVTDATVVGSAPLTGTSDTPTQKVVSIRYDPARETRKGIFYQVRLVNGAYDEGVEVCCIDYSVAGLSVKGTKQAAKTR